MSKEISEKNVETQKKMFPIGETTSWVPIMNMLNDIGKAKNPQAEIFQAIVQLKKTERNIDINVDNHSELHKKFGLIFDMA
jgi:hypothetical protein